MEVEEASKDDGNEDQGQGEQLCLASIKNIFMQEFVCVEQQFWDFKDQICKTVVAAENGLK